MYLAEGYDKPKETIGTEEIVYVKKGMVAQRALPYTEVDTEWMLLLDDDIEIAPNGIEEMFQVIQESEADVCAMDAFPHNNYSLNKTVSSILTLRAFPRLFGKKKGYTISWMGPDWYNPHPGRYTYSNTNSGNAVMARKSDFLNIRFDEDLWLDESPYALPDDSVMHYKMHLIGLKIVTIHNNLFVHLDGKTSIEGERLHKIIYSEAKNSKIFRNLYFYPSLNFISSLIAKGLAGLRSSVRIFQYKYLSNDSTKAEAYKRGIKDAQIYLNEHNMSLERVR